MPTNAFWCLNLNFGDRLTPFIIERFAGEKPFYIDLKDDTKKVMAVGSTLNWANKSCVVWGSGIGNKDEWVNPETTIKAVRGKLSYEACMKSKVECPEVFGDPAIILPKLYLPKTYMKYEIGVLPHYIEQDLVFDFILERGYKFINVFDEIEKVINDICSCDCILSSSLHGLIVADAYQIPNKWVVISDRLCGDGTKFHDYYSTTTLPDEKPINFVELKNCGSNDIKNMTKVKESIIDIGALLKAVPFGGQIL